MARFYVGQKVKFTKIAEASLGGKADSKQVHSVLAFRLNSKGEIYDLGGEHFDVHSHWLESVPETVEHHPV